LLRRLSAMTEPPEDRRADQSAWQQKDCGEIEPAPEKVTEEGRRHDLFTRV